MTSGADRMLEISLAEVLGGVAPPDLTMRIRLAIQREQEGREPAAPRTDSQERSKRKLTWLMACAALLLSLLSGIAVWMLNAGSSIIATSPSKLRIVDSNGKTRWSDGFVAGDRIIVLRSERASFTLQSGAEIDVEGATSLRFAMLASKVVPEVHVGILHIRQTGANRAGESQAGESKAEETGLVLKTPFGSLETAPGSRVELEVESDPWIDYAGLQEIGDLDLARVRQRGASLRLGVETGSAVLFGEKEDLLVRAGESIALSGDGALSRTPLPESGDRRLLMSLLTKLRVGAADVDPKLEDAFQRRKRGVVAAKDLRALLAKKPGYWPYMTPRLRIFPRDESRLDIRWRLLRLLARDPNLAMASLLEKAISEEPRALDLDTILLLGEREFEPAVSRLASIVVTDGPLVGRIIPAAFLGMRGDARGRKILNTALTNRSLLSASSVRYFAAASALAVLGDKAAWQRAVRNLSREVERRIEMGQLRSAQHLALSAHYFHEVAKTRQPRSLSEPGWTLVHWIERHGNTYKSAVQLRALVKTLGNL